MCGVEKGDILGQVAFIARLFGVGPKLNKRWDFTPIAFFPDFLQHNQYRASVQLLISKAILIYKNLCVI